MADEGLLSEKKKNGQRLAHRASNFGHSDRIVQSGLELRFKHLDFSIKDKQILEDVSGTARPGKVLAVMGPSGSGKTTLLNILGGRIECPRCQATIGGQQLTKQTRRKISYVLQQDIFFPNLTLKQTLQFAAELRLPETMTSRVKEEIVSELIDQLDMQKCINTIIGDNITRGLSGGEKKRANIANELLTDPAVLLLDEPTSGLDSSTAYALTLSLKRYAVQSSKTVLMTIHQPSVQMFFQFDDILLLSGGKVAYYGSPENVLKHFEEMGFTCDVTHYNPADFILDVVKSGTEASEKLIEASNRRRLNTFDCPVLRRDMDQKHIPLGNHIMTSQDDTTKVSVDEENNEKENGCKNGLANDVKDAHLEFDGVIVDGITTKPGMHSSDLLLNEPQQRWPTSYFHQTKILTIRSFIQGRYRYISKLKLIKTVGVAIIMGLVWFQIGRGDVTESKVLDIVGSLFFLCLFNAFNSLFDVLVIFPSEREVVNKERMSGSYRLSAYYVSKSFSELPLCLVLPSISTVVFYWMAGLNGFNNFVAFFGTWIVMIGITIASQSIGLFVSAATMDFEHGLVLAIFVMITFMLLGGFYVKNFPIWIRWMRYISPFYSAWTLMLFFEFDSNSRVRCNSENSVYPSCDPSNSNNITVSSNQTRYVPAQEILTFNTADTPPWICAVAIVASLVMFRVLGYFMLRLFHKPIRK